ncbi:hypothetical protein BDZ97DRAFT_1915328 [Flammula alnicola]|nr:hypothetical protein BDZ97DRAFT_1915328 [Flammula alnicola]
MGYPNDYLEETLREVFSIRPGYRKLCLGIKPTDLCVSSRWFEDVQYAAKALVEMSGNTLRGAVKNGIRLSYSKNPLGVRTPTSAGGSNSGGPTLLQQQQLMQTLSNHHQYQQHGQHGHQQQQPPPPSSAGSGSGSSVTAQQDSFQSRLADDYHRLPTSILRRDSVLSPPATASLAQAQAAYMGAGSGSGGGGNSNSFFSSPPPRFYGSSPGTQLTGASSAFVPRSAAAAAAAVANGGNGLGGMGMFSSNGVGVGVGGYAGSSSAGFSPFGMSFASGSGESPFAPPPSSHLHHPSLVQQHSIPDGQQQHPQHQHQQQHQQSDD